MRLHKICAVLVSMTLAVGSFAAPTAAMQIQAAGNEGKTNTDFVGLDAEYHTQEDIRQFYEQHPIKMMEAEYKENPSVTAPYSPGELTDETKQDALNMLNLYRYIAGLPTVSITEEAQNYAQAAALASAINGRCAHIPDCPADMDSDLCSLAIYGSFNSNLAAWGNQLATTIQSYMRESNGDIDYGHRRQLLDCGYTEAGFGMADSARGTSYSATYIDANLDEDKIISYPGQNQPLEYFEAGDAWTVVVPEKVEKENVHVKLTNTKTGKTWNFDEEGDDFRISTKYPGATCFIFIPSDLYYGEGAQYQVEITGTMRPISYQVNFFLLEERIPVTELSAYVSGLGLHIKDSGILQVVISPENATVKNVTWSSSNPEIVETGRSGGTLCWVRPKKAGTAIITATEVDSGCTFDFTVEVYPNAERVELDATDVTIGRGQYFYLQGKAFPKEATDSVMFRADSDIISLGDSSDVVKVTGEKIGKTTITAYAYSDYDVETICHVNVVEPVYATKIRLDQEEVEMKKGETLQLNTIFSPSNVTCKELEWSTSNINIATVEDGVVTCVGNYGGEAEITVRARDGSGQEATCTVSYYGKWKQATPPKKDSCTSDTVVLKEYERDFYTYEYSIDGIHWQDSNVFSGLEAECEYTFYRRIKGENYIRTGDASEGTVIKTAAAKVAATTPPRKQLDTTGLWEEKPKTENTAETETDEKTKENKTTGTEINKTTGIEINKTFAKGNGRYRILSSSAVAVIGLKNKKAARFTIPSSVKYGKKKYQVTQIGTGAFKNCKKLKSIAIQSVKLKSAGKNAFKGIKATARIKVPAKKYKAYKKLLKGKGQGKRVKIIKL